jgi:flagellar basal body-associated protein FliL
MEFDYSLYSGAIILGGVLGIVAAFVYVFWYRKNSGPKYESSTATPNEELDMKHCDGDKCYM